MLDLALQPGRPYHSLDDLPATSLCTSVEAQARAMLPGTEEISNTAGELRDEFDSGAGAWRIEGNIDGNGAADFLILVTAAGPLASGDFVL